MVAVTRNGRRAIASGETPSLSRKNAIIKFKKYTKATGFPRSAMARRSFCVTATIRKSQETRSQTRPLPTFPCVQNASSVALARLRGVLARRREGRFPDWSPYTHVYRHTSNVLRHKNKFSQKNTTCKLRSISRSTFYCASHLSRHNWWYAFMLISSTRITAFPARALLAISPRPHSPSLTSSKGGL